MMAVAEAETHGARTDDVVEEWLTREAPKLGGTPVLFTHALSVPLREPLFAPGLFLRYIADRRRLFLVRDPRDTVVSHYFHLTKRARDGLDPETNPMSEFVRDPVRGIDRILLFLRACSASAREHPGPAMFLSYEDLHESPLDELRSALEFFGAPTADSALRSAVEFGSFENMQRLERQRSAAGQGTRLVARTPGDPESFKTRQGKVGGYVEYLSEEDVEYIDERIAALLPEAMGYRQPGASPQSVVPGR